MYKQIMSLRYAYILAILFFLAQLLSSQALHAFPKPTDQRHGESYSAWITRVEGITLSAAEIRHREQLARRRTLENESLERHKFLIERLTNALYRWGTEYDVFNQNFQLSHEEILGIARDQAQVLLDLYLAGIFIVPQQAASSFRSLLRQKLRCYTLQALREEGYLTDALLVRGHLRLIYKLMSKLYYRLEALGAISGELKNLTYPELVALGVETSFEMAAKADLRLGLFSTFLSPRAARIGKLKISLPFLVQLKLRRIQKTASIRPFTQMKEDATPDRPRVPRKRPKDFSMFEDPFQDKPSGLETRIQGSSPYLGEIKELTSLLFSTYANERKQELLVHTQTIIPGFEASDLEQLATQSTFMPTTAFQIRPELRKRLEQIRLHARDIFLFAARFENLSKPVTLKLLQKRFKFANHQNVVLRLKAEWIRFLAFVGRPEPQLSPEFRNIRSRLDVLLDLSTEFTCNYTLSRLSRDPHIATAEDLAKLYPKKQETP